MKGYHKVNLTLVSGKLAISEPNKAALGLFKGYENDYNCLFLKNI